MISEKIEMVGIATRVRAPLYAAMRQMAQSEDRSLANLMTILLAEAMEARSGTTFETRLQKRGRKPKCCGGEVAE